jgi:hypothetical protein
MGEPVGVMGESVGVDAVNRSESVGVGGGVEAITFKRKASINIRFWKNR